jgi:hypothetical protein
MRAIVGNAGLEVAPIVHEAQRRAATRFSPRLDVLCGEWVDAYTGASWTREGDPGRPKRA